MPNARSWDGDRLLAKEREQLLKAAEALALPGLDILERCPPHGAPSSPVTYHTRSRYAR